MTRDEKVAASRDLYANGRSIRDIATAMGVTYATVWKWLNPERAKEFARRSNHRPGRNAAKRAWDRENRPPCPKCGGSKSRYAELCQACWEATPSERVTLLVEMWRAGDSLPKIAAALDTTVNSVGVSVTYLRRQGVELAYRHKGFPLGKPTFELPIAEARSKNTPVAELGAREAVDRLRRAPQRKAWSLFHAAVQRGELVRPDSCSRCGEVGRVEGHHPDYSRPLDVEWLCFDCHRETHREAA